MADSARLGFHAAYENRTGVQAESGLGNAVLGAYVTQLALPLSAVVYIAKAKPTDMTWLTINDARRVGIDIETLHVEATTKKSSAPASSGPAETASPTNVEQRWVVVGSSADLNNAISAATKYKPEFRGTTVLRSQNGRFAIALGKFSVDEANALLSNLKTQKKVPDDAYLSAGSRLISIDWQ